MSAMQAGPAQAGKFSRVRVVSLGTSKLLFVSGLTSGGELSVDIRKQAEATFQRIGEALAEHGANLSHLVKITAFLTDLRDYDGYNEVRNRIFGEFPNPPASATVGTTQLVRPEWRIEIEAVAAIQ